jgi:hypothetical protein
MSDARIVTALALFLAAAGGAAPPAGVVFTEDAADASAGNVPCFKIETPAATYYLEKAGAGLSSMIDREGRDWIGFHPKPGSGAGGEYRGFPNAVHKQDGSFFHPKNRGTDPSRTRVVHRSADRVTIEAVSGNEAWRSRWDFYPAHCTFTMTRMPQRRAYWILYEGTPGGSFDATDWWMTSAVKERQPVVKTHEGDIPSPEWIVFGDRAVKRVLYLFHHEDDDAVDRFYQMKGQMTVFGFGRKGLEKYLTTVPQSFSIGFLEATEHPEIAKALKRLEQGEPPIRLTKP